MPKISELPVVTTILGDELIPVVQNGTTKRATAGALIAGTILTPEQFGAVGNANFEDASGNWFEDAALTIPANNDYTAFKSLYDELNRRRGGHVVCAPYKNYWLNNVVYQPTLTFTSTSSSFNLVGLAQGTRLMEQLSLLMGEPLYSCWDSPGWCGKVMAQ
jgi:hypothetical protein